MELQIVQDEGENVVGFDLISDCDAHEDLFIRELDNNLFSGSARITMSEDLLTIINDELGIRSFKIEGSPSKVIKAYLEDNDTEPHIKIERNFGARARIRFVNEKVKKIFQK